MDKRTELALDLLKTCCPHLAGLIAVIDLRFDVRIRTAAVCPSGRILLSPKFAEKLQIPELAFVIGHELYHCFYHIFDRITDESDQLLVNIAHDCIVNNMLIKVFTKNGLPDACPENLLHWEDFKNIVNETCPGAWRPVENYSMEKLTALLEKVSDKLPASPFGRRIPRKKQRMPSPMNDAFSRIASDLGFPDSETEEHADEDASWEYEDGEPNGIPEIFSDDLERKFFPEDSPANSAERKKQLARAVETARQEKVLLENFRKHIERSERNARKFSVQRGTRKGNEYLKVKSLESSYAPPWESVIQTWIDNTLPPQRSWAKASRRTSPEMDVVLPGRLHRTDQKRSITIILDTSGSMEHSFSLLLGMIGSFCSAAGISEVRIIQCDVQVTSDETIVPEKLREYEIRGFGGSDMSPAMMKLSTDPKIHSVLVLTDGYIAYPPKEWIPYRVLWGIFTPSGSLYDSLKDGSFKPDYGTVLKIKLPEY